MNLNKFPDPDYFKDHVSPDIWDSTVKIIKINDYRHLVHFTEEDDKSSISFCNLCGSTFITKFIILDEDKKDSDKSKMWKCSECKLGPWAKKLEREK